MTPLATATLTSAQIVSAITYLREQHKEERMVGNTPPGCDGANFPDRAHVKTEAQIAADERSAHLHDVIVDIMSASDSAAYAASYRQTAAERTHVERCRAMLEAAKSAAEKAGGSL